MHKTGNYESISKKNESQNQIAKMKPNQQNQIAKMNPYQQSGNDIASANGYRVRKLAPAKNYDVISMARAMNENFGEKVQFLFKTEKEAAIEAAESGIYISWRCPEFTWDCQRVAKSSRCFCGHNLNEHAKYTGKSLNVPCKSCVCKAFVWMASKPEEIGEYWLPKRQNFDAEAWRPRCKCKHHHEEHNPNRPYKCKKCSCFSFMSDFLCAACDRRWEEHETVFETEHMRKQAGMQIGVDYLPFSEIPSLRNMVLTGKDDEDMSYMKLQNLNKLSIKDRNTNINFKSISDGKT